MSSEIEIVDFSKIDVYLIRGNIKDNPEHLKEIHQKSFKCWHNTWDDFYHGEHHSSAKLNSNEFTRQDDVLALFYEDECFAITFFKEVFWSDSTASLDAYFNAWGPEAIEGLRKNGDRVLICSQFTVAKSFRNRNVDIPWKSILFFLSIKCFLESKSDVMTGMMRVKKGMGKMSVQAGGSALALNVICKDHEDEPADLIGFFKEGVGRVYNNHPYNERFNEVWSRKNGEDHSQLRLVA
ncbi:MAG: hypothetical protein K2Q18_10460 [Bdellovibrionales bacterium]|nr:hypothetical protein [Bdellovibrionales bacterium]